MQALGALFPNSHYVFNFARTPKGNAAKCLLVISFETYGMALKPAKNTFAIAKENN
jgi:hypothetical protein